MSAATQNVFEEKLDVALIGLELFAEELAGQGQAVTQVDWRPPAVGAEAPLSRLAHHARKIAQANDEATQRLQDARPLIVGTGVARDLLPAMADNTFLHAGPPIDWGDMTGPMRGAIIGAAMHEGLADSVEEAVRQADRGEYEFGPCHDRGAIGPMTGIVSASMPMWIIENETAGNRAYCTFNEGLGKVLRFGAYSQEVLDRLQWIDDVLWPVLTKTLEVLGEPIDLRAMIAQALQMGDESHNRHRAGTSLLLRQMMPAFITLDHSSDEVAEVARFIAANDHFFLNLSMPAAKSAADSAAGIESSTILTAMARSGREFAVRTSGTGDRWFSGPAPMVDGLYLPGFTADDANPDIGDSTITETVGWGGFSMVSAPAIVRFVGGQAADAESATRSMYEIAWSESEHYQLPALDFRGAPLGIDCREVVHTGVLPFVNTGIAHKDPGVGQIGAGVVTPPIEAFLGAIEALAETIDT